MKIFEFEICNGIGILTFNGVLDSQSEDVLKEALSVALETCRHVLVNLERVTRIDDRCLQIFDAAREQALKLKKRMAFCGLGRGD